MAKNPVLKRLTGSGNFTVPAGVKFLKVYAIPSPPQNVFTVNDAVHAIASGGRVYGWGSGANGRLGDGTLVSKSEPTVITPINNLGEIVAVGNKSSAFGGALTRGGTLYMYGFNSQGYLGDGTTTSQSTPTEVLGGHAFEKVDFKGYTGNMVALKAGGEVWTWGFGANGQLGNNAELNSSSPVQVIGGHSFEEAISGERNVIARKADGTIWGWGRDSGNLNTGGDVSSPVQIQVGTVAEEIAAGENMQFALQNDGSLLSWGAANSSGQLGDGTTVSKSTPVAVVGATVFTTVAAGNNHAAALDENGAAWCWGLNTEGQLGDGTIVSKSSPVQVIGGHTFVEILCSLDGTFARKADGSIWCWGEDRGGNFGQGVAPTTYSSPVQVIGGNNFSGVTAAGLVNVFTPSPGDVLAYDTANGLFGGFPAINGAQEFLVEFFG